MYGKNIIRHSLTDDGSLSHSTSRHDSHRYIALGPPSGTYTGTSAPAHRLASGSPDAGRNQKVHFLARFSFCLTLSRLLWNSLKVNRNISFFFGYLSQSLNVSKKCTFWSVFLYILSNTLIVHAHNVTQADRISVCPFSIYDTLIDKNYPVRSVMCYRLALL